MISPSQDSTIVVAPVASQPVDQSATVTTAATTTRPKPSPKVTIPPLSEADSAYIFGVDTSFAQLCQKDVVRNDFAKSSHIAYSASPSSTVVSDSLAQAISITRPTESILMTPTPRGTTPLHAYADVALTGVGASLAVLAVVKGISSSFISELTSFLSDGLGWKKIVKSASGQTSVALLLMDVFFVLVMSVLSVEAVKLFAPTAVANFGEWTLTGIAISTIVLSSLARLILDHIIGFAFDISEKTSQVVLYKKTSFGIIGLALFPIALALPFVSTENSYLLCDVALGIVILLSAWRVTRTTKIFMRDLPDFLHFILYLCIVEAAPLVLIYKVLTLGQS